MKTAIAIFKKHGAHYYEGDEEAIIEAMREYASQAIDRYCINTKAMVGNRTFEQIAELTKSELK